MESDPSFEDLTPLFHSLQEELEAADIGQATSLETQLRAVESDLTRHFENPAHLGACLRTGGLTYEHAFLKRTHPWSAPILAQLLQEYRVAKAVDHSQLFLTLANSHETIGRAYEHLVSTAMLESMFTESNTRVFVKRCFGSIGEVIESSLLPFLKIRLNVLRIAAGTATPARDVDGLSLGQTIDELAQTDPDTYSPAPFGVRLSQWRNIAFHGNYRVRGKTVHCWYGKRPERFECTPDQLRDLAKYADSVYYVHKVAHELFGIDNAERFVEFSRTSGKPFEALVFDSDFNSDTILAYSIAASGFRIQNAGRKGRRWMLVLEDRHRRTKGEAEITLKKALASYLMNVHSFHLQALIQSGDTGHFVSFRGELTSSQRELLPGEHIPYTIGSNFRVDDSPER